MPHAFKAYISIALHRLGLNRTLQQLGPHFNISQLQKKHGRKPLTSW